MRGLRSWLRDPTTLPGRSVLAWLVGLLVLLVGSSRGQGPNRSSAKFYPDSSDTAEALLRNAASHARDRQWAAAIEIYQRVIDQFGDKVARLPNDDAAVNLIVVSSCMWTTAAFAMPRLLIFLPRPRDLSQPGRCHCRAMVRPGSQRAGRRTRSVGSSTRHFAVRGATMRSSSWGISRFRTAASAKPWQCIGGWCRIAPLTPVCWFIPIRRSTWQKLRPRN